MGYKSQEYEKALKARRDRTNASKKANKEREELRFGKVKGGFDDACTCAYSRQVY